MAFKGTRRRSARDIAEAIENVGGDLNAETGVERTSYFARVIGERRGPRARRDRRHSHRQRVRSGRTRAREERHHAGDRRGRGHAGRSRVRSAHRDRLARPTDRPADSRHARGGRGLRPGRASTDISAAVTAPAPPWSPPLARSNTIILSPSPSHASKGFRPRPRRPKREPLIAAARPSVNRRLEQTHVVVGFEGRPVGAPDHDAAQVFAAAAGGGMSSRLFQEVREKRGLAYSIYAFHWDFTDTGLFGFYAGSADRDAARGRRGLARLPGRSGARA